MNGAKADNLRLLKDNGINVPDFVVIPSDGSYDGTILKPDKTYAVRSSCSLEDGNDFSFAGQFDTFLNVPADDVNTKIKECFASMRTPNVAEYAISNNITMADIRMNVIVQEMVLSDMSGVLFTANPKGILNESVITVGRGLGDGVVSDKVDTTS
ncbi:MAG: phosphoenolpyruvate synthase, partial [Clostridiales bacterium]|nr:phosphoenolpyruvate synthase [Clostridiales bacterium]